MRDIDPYFDDRHVPREEQRTIRSWHPGQVEYRTAS